MRHYTAWINDHSINRFCGCDLELTIAIWDKTWKKLKLPAIFPPIQYMYYKCYAKIGFIFLFYAFSLVLLDRATLVLDKRHELMTF